MTDVPIDAPACRAPLHPLVRFIILFGVLYPLRQGLRWTSLPALPQLALVAAVGSGLVLWLWGPCASRRGPYLVIASLWGAVLLRALLG
jgi:hypothetical protein